MRVKLATQVFSNSVVVGLRHYKYYNRCLNNYEGTISFTQRYNDLFDVLNRRHPSEGIHPLSVDFQVLNENLAFFNKWEKTVQDGNISKDMYLTDNTALGLRISLLSTIELTNFLLSDCGFKYVLTNKMNQDPLEV